MVRKGRTLTTFMVCRESSTLNPPLFQLKRSTLAGHFPTQLSSRAGLLLRMRRAARSDSESEDDLCGIRIPDRAETVIVGCQQGRREDWGAQGKYKKWGPAKWIV